MQQEERQYTCIQYIADTMFYKGQNLRLVRKLSEILDPEPQMPPMTQEEIIDKLKKGGVIIT